MRKRKMMSVFAAILAVSMVFSGCGSASEDKTETKTASGETGGENSTDESITRDEIVIGGRADIKSTDPAGQSDVYSSHLIRHLYNGLLKIDEDGTTVIGDLAESFDMPDDTTYHFVLRKGVKFHNGEELKASDVVFTLERAREMAATKAVAVYFDTITADNDYEVTLTLNKPCAAMLYLLTGTNVKIVNEKAVTEAGDQYVEHPVGTGPFKFVEWEPNDHWTIERFDDYFGEKPMASKLTCRVLAEESARTIALETGEIDLALDVAETEAINVEESDTLVLESGPSPSIEYLGLNYQNKYLADKNVRKAIAHAINLDDIVLTVVEGRGYAANTCIGRTIPGWNEEQEPYSYDPELSKKLLKEAGYEDGFEIGLIVNSDIRNRSAQILQSQLKEIGITVDISMYDFGAYLDMMKDGECDMFISGWTNGNVDPERSTTPLFHGDYCGRNGSNYSFMQNEEVDELLDAAASELDYDKRMNMYHDLQALIQEEVPIVPLYYKINMVGRNKDLKGFVFDKNVAHYFGNLHYTN